MKLSKIVIPAMLAISLTLVGCGEKIKNSTNTQEGTKIENKESNESNENSSSLKYDVTKEVIEVEDKNNKIFYPQVKDFSGQLLMDYMNQSLKRIPDIYANEEPYTDVQIDYEITKMDENVLSVLFKGTGKIKDFGEINIQQSINLDMVSSNEITYDNLIKNDEESRKEVTKILNEKAKEKGLSGFEAEGVRIYFNGENVVFSYMPLDDSAKEFIELSVPGNELEGYINTDFGEAPAS